MSVLLFFLIEKCFAWFQKLDWTDWSYRFNREPGTSPVQKTPQNQSKLDKNRVKLGTIGKKGFAPGLVFKTMAFCNILKILAKIVEAPVKTKHHL